jgi:hypothetical protein
LFTVTQAGRAGLDRRTRHHHLTYGNWRRTDAPDVFRLTGWPDDRHERLHAWMLWAGPGSALTSWTALGLLGLAASGPRVPVDLEIRFGHDRAGQRRRSRLGRQISHDSGVPAARLHPVGPSHGLAIVEGMAVRSAAHALCAAVESHPASMAVSLCGHLLDRGHVTESELALAAHDLGCSRVVELLFRRWGR